MVFGSKKQRPRVSEVYLDDADDERSLGSGTEASFGIPPPPPPAPIDSRKNSGLFRSQAVEEGLPRHAYLIEECDSIESVDMTMWPSYWNDWFGTTGLARNNRNPRRRRACVGLACLLVVCMILGLAIGVSNNGGTERSSSFAGAAGAQVGSGTQGPPGPADEANGGPGPADEANEGPPGPANEGPPGPANEGPPGPADEGPPGPAEEGPTETAEEGPTETAEEGPTETAEEGPTETAEEGPTETAEEGPTETAEEGPTETAEEGPTETAEEGPTETAEEGPTETADEGPTETEADTECETRIATDRSCYAPMTEMFLGFSNCDAEHDDWIGIFTIDGLEMDDLGEPDMWLWTCNSQVLQDCNAVGTFVDDLTFGGGLPAGVYQAHLVHRNVNGGGPYASYAASEVFVIEEGC
jgi:hypothetical protein